MRPVDRHPELQGMLKVLRIIMVVLALGVAGFLGYVHFGVSEPVGFLLFWGHSLEE